MEHRRLQRGGSSPVPRQSRNGRRRGGACGSLTLLTCALLLLSSFACVAQVPQPATPAPTMTPGATAEKRSSGSNPFAGRIEYAEFPSPSLGRNVRYAVSLPPSYDKKGAQRYPLVIFLHGLNNDERDWESRCIETKLEALRAASKVGDFIVAIPYGANSFYLNAHDGTRYEDAIVKDFLPFVDKTYRTLASPRSRLIEGISMGGYGALLIAFKHPELFAGVAAHSAALFDELPQPPKSPEDRGAKYRYDLATKLFGAPPDPAFFQANNPLHLARTNAAAIKRLKIYFDIGESDRYGFERGNAQLSAVLKAAGVAHEYTLAPGAHGWSFLSERSEPAFTFVWNTVR
ncbi:MAG TPA: alpha/beta hydrolase-fold protein [Pyrinomonadaceae bacterium]|jgi:S-formylglutathione hydrolase FrmB|nr:alpha/beta hydrolase-fold protein [Pyrinomonadaceae bacterium]